MQLAKIAKGRTVADRSISPQPHTNRFPASAESLDGHSDRLKVEAPEHHGDRGRKPVPSSRPVGSDIDSENFFRLPIGCSGCCGNRTDNSLSWTTSSHVQTVRGDYPSFRVRERDSLRLERNYPNMGSHNINNQSIQGKHIRFCFQRMSEELLQITRLHHSTPGTWYSSAHKCPIRLAHLVLCRTCFEIVSNDESDYTPSCVDFKSSSVP